MGDAPLTARSRELGVAMLLLLAAAACGPRDTESAPPAPAPAPVPSVSADSAAAAGADPAAANPDAMVLSADCAACHAAGSRALAAPVDSTHHAAQELLYAGDGSLPPAPMHEARVECAACHRIPAAAGPTDSAARAEAINGECQACHGPRFARLLPEWIQAMRRNTDTVGRYVAAAEQDARVKRNGTAAAAVARARSAWEVVEAGNGVHHLAAADSLLRLALAGTADAYAAAGSPAPPRPRLGPDPAVESCARCHYGAQLQAGTFAGRSFNHGPHVEAGLACATCHSDVDLFHRGEGGLDPHHGRTQVTEADCASCHHREPERTSCASCHDAMTLAPATAHVSVAVGSRAPVDRDVTWSHAAHEDVACASCHRTPGTLEVTADVSSCVACHDDHHTEDRACAACHSVRASVAVHQRDDHLACAECHARETIARILPDRGTCLVCHAAQTDHYADGARECSSCHFLQTPQELQTRILEGAP